MWIRAGDADTGLRLLAPHLAAGQPQVLAEGGRAYYQQGRFDEALLLWDRLETLPRGYTRLAERARRLATSHDPPAPLRDRLRLLAPVR